jgi:lysophospholipase L1-like esterase
MENSKIAPSELAMEQSWARHRRNIEASVIPGSGGVVFLGDSLTHIGRWETRYPGLRIHNFGIHGERSEHLLLRLAPVISLRPEKLFLLIGTNDLAVGCTLEETAANVASILDQLGSALPGCRIYLQTMMPRAEKFAQRVKALNAAYVELAQQRGLALIDLCPLFDDGRGAIRKDLSHDNVHLTELGYDVWRAALAPYLGVES